MTSCRLPEQLRQSWVAWNVTLCISACKGGVLAVWNKGPPKVLVTAEVETDSQAHNKPSETKPIDTTQGVTEGTGNCEWKAEKWSTSISLWTHTVTAPLLKWADSRGCSAPSDVSYVQTCTGPTINQPEWKSTRTIWLSKWESKKKETHYCIIFTFFFYTDSYLDRIGLPNSIAYGQYPIC